jgi:hypothetical protein
MSTRPNSRTTSRRFYLPPNKPYLDSPGQAESLRAFFLLFSSGA